jgi:hypothetical protein
MKQKFCILTTVLMALLFFNSCSLITEEKTILLDGSKSITAPNLQAISNPNFKLDEVKVKKLIAASEKVKNLTNAKIAALKGKNIISRENFLSLYKLSDSERSIILDFTSCLNNIKTTYAFIESPKLNSLLKEVYKKELLKYNNNGRIEGSDDQTECLSFCDDNLYLCQQQSWESYQMSLAICENGGWTSTICQDYCYYDYSYMMYYCAQSFWSCQANCL